MRRAGLFVGVSCFVVVALALARPRAGTARWRETPWEEEPDAADARPRWSSDGADKRDRPPPSPPPSTVDAPASTPAAYRALSELELATLRRLDPELFSNLPPEAGAWDPRSRNPCFRDRRDPSSGPPPLRCLPFYHVVGAWQSGTRAFNAELAAARRSVHLAPETHFWNEDKPVRAEYLPRFDAFAASSPDRRAAKKKNYASLYTNESSASVASPSSAFDDDAVVGDPSPGVLCNTWTESQRLHRAFKDAMAECWAKCRDAHSAPSDEARFRRCVDGAEPGGGCFRVAHLADRDAHGVAPGDAWFPTHPCVRSRSETDRFVSDNNSTSGDRRPTLAGSCPTSGSGRFSSRGASRYLSVPHAMRAAYGDRDVKIVMLLREPTARLMAAFSHYEHYRRRFGGSETKKSVGSNASNDSLSRSDDPRLRGFASFADAFLDAFDACVADRAAEGVLDPRLACAHRFEAYDATNEAVFYHCDQLIKSMYGTFAPAWVETFGAENVLALRTEDAFAEDAATRRRQIRNAARFVTGEEDEEGEDRGDLEGGGEGGSAEASRDISEAFRDDAELATRAFDRASVDGAVLRRLDAFFRPEKEALAKLFGDEKFLWREFSDE